MRKGRMLPGICLFKLQQCKIISKLLLLLVCIPLLVPRSVWARDKEWKELESKHFVVFYEKASEGHRVLDEAESLYPRITSDFNYYPMRKINVYVYHSHSRFLAQSPSGVTRAYSQPFMNKMFISATQESVESSVAHELSHIVFLQSLPDSSKVPFWFVEGIAIHQSQLGREPSEVESYSLPENISSISSLSKKEPKGMQEQRRVAVEGYLIIKYLVDKYGEDRLNLLTKHLQKGMDFSIALEKSLGVSGEELDKAWYEYAAARSRQVYIQNLQYFGFLVLGLLVVITTAIWFGKRKKEQKKLEQEAEEESDLLPPF